MIKFLYKSGRENQNTHFMLNDFFPKIVPFFFKIMWKSIRRRMTIWHMRTLWWITKAIDTNSAYVILTAFQLQQWLHERVPVLRYTTLPVL